MPMYNASSYLRECIDSVLEQTFTDFELLIADDGSTDDSVAIVKSYADPRIRLICRQHDYIATLNCLIDEARGKYIARMDADDVMMPSRLQLQVDILQQHPEIDILGSELKCNHENNCNMLQEQESPKLTHLTLFDFAKHNSLINPTVIMRTERIRQFSLRYDVDYRFAEDYKFWVDAIKLGLSVWNSSIAVLIYRNSPSQVSNMYSTQMSAQALLIANSCQDSLSKAANTHYVEPSIPYTGTEVTVIIPFLNEGDELINTVANIRQICGDKIDILVVNDHSYDSIDYISALKKYNVIYLYNEVRRGVAGCRDLAISLIQTPYFLLLDGHMRIYDYTSIENIISLLTKNDRCILCGQSVPLDMYEGELVLRADYKKGYGAFNPMRKGRLLPDIEWCQTEHDASERIEEIPTILGAAYAGSKRYWTYLKGLQGLKSYGFDESYISNKVWLEGGKCLLLKDFITGHLYRNESPYSTLNADKIYNSLLICSLFYGETEMNHTRAFALASNYSAYFTANLEFEANKLKIDDLVSYYKTIFVYDKTFLRGKHQKEVDNTIQLIYSSDNNSVFTDNLYIRQEIEQIESLSLIDGLGAIILHLRYAYSLSKREKLLDKALEKYCNLIETELEKVKPNIGFHHGLSGCGWLLLHLDQYLHSDILERIEEVVEKAVLSRTNSAEKSFEKGVGGIICFALSRLASNRFTDNYVFWVLLHDICTQILHEPDYDEETYFFALQYISMISGSFDGGDYIPSISDWLTLPSRGFKYSSRSLKDGELGYELLKSILTNRPSNV